MALSAMVFQLFLYSFQATTKLVHLFFQLNQTIEIQIFACKLVNQMEY